MSEDTTRPLVIPPEGVLALQTILGIMDDNELPVDGDLMDALDRKLVRCRDGLVELTMVETDLLLRGLRFTEAASIMLPFYEDVVTTVEFVGAALMDLWSADEWAGFGAPGPA